MCFPLGAACAWENLQVLPPGEPWQRRVLLKGSAITLEQWQARRMLRRGRCHFCCRWEHGHHQPRLV